MTSAVDDMPKGIIAQRMEDGAPVILKLVNELPEDAVRGDLPWLAVLSWKYDGSSRNGFPVEADLGRMMRLEKAIEDSVEAKGVLRHAYSRTGNNLKELVYYIRDRNDFLGRLNAALRGHERYPIEINFYDDAQWKDFRMILDGIARAEEAS